MAGERSRIKVCLYPAIFAAPDIAFVLYNHAIWIFTPPPSDCAVTVEPGYTHPLTCSSS